MASTPLDVPARRGAAERRLYGGAALVAALVVFAGFAPTYYLRGAFGGRELDVLRQVHGAVMTAWFTLFLVQARLVATGNVRVHRKLGWAGVGLAVLVLVVGTRLAIATARSGVTPIPVPPLVFLVVPLGEMFAFAGLFTAAVLLRRRGGWHKRLMLLASVAMLTPAFARLSLRVLGGGAPPLFFGLVDLILLACIAFDTVRNRRLHPAFAVGFAFVLAVQAGRLLLARTTQWTAFAQWLVG